MTADKALAVAKARAEVCDPRGSHRPIQTSSVSTIAGRMRYRYCGDCESWVDPSPVFSQESAAPVGRATVPA